MAVALGSDERAGFRREPELREAPDFEVGPTDLPGQDDALLEVAFGVGKPQERFDGTRFISAIARRSLPSAISSSDCPVTGESRNLACS